MTADTSLRSHLRKSILKQSALGIVAMAVVLISVTYLLGRYKAASDLAETAAASTRAFRGRILDGESKAIESQLQEVLKIRPDERALILDQDKKPVYKGTNVEPVSLNCKQVSVPCLNGYGSNAEILMPIYFDESGKNLFGYLYLSKKIQPDWFFLFIVSIVFALGYFAVFFGVTRITKSTMEMLADGLEKWSNRLSRDPKDVKSLSETPFKELMPLKTAIEGLNRKIEEFESKAAEKAKLLVLRGIAHDLLEPVSQVQLYLATLQKKAASNPEFAPLIFDTVESIKKVSAIASQVKILKEIPSPNDSIDLVSEINEQIKELKNSYVIKEKRIELILESGSLSSVKARLSRPELTRILHNLVQNSAHASGMNARIEIAVMQDDGHAILSVKDHGHGIRKEIQEKVFQPDFTLKPGTGTGLGLTIVKHIAEMRKGHVLLNSVVGAGTLIQVKIPVFSDEGVTRGL